VNPLKKITVQTCDGDETHLAMGDGVSYPMVECHVDHIVGIEEEFHRRLAVAKEVVEFSIRSVDIAAATLLKASQDAGKTVDTLRDAVAAVVHTERDRDAYAEMLVQVCTEVWNDSEPHIVPMPDWLTVAKAKYEAKHGACASIDELLQE
jgi:hypothetical protein